MNSLSRVGIVPDAIDTVILTHGHLDHVGGTLLANGAIAFPNARFVIARAEWEFWDQDQPDLSALQISDATRHRFTDVAHAKLRPLRERIELIETDVLIRPGVSARMAPGHTPGHLLVEIASQGKLLLFVSDLVFTPLSIDHPEWHSRFEDDVAASQASKLTHLARAAQEGALVYAMHFPWPGLGKIKPAADRWTWEVAGAPIAPDALISIQHSP